MYKRVAPRFQSLEDHLSEDGVDKDSVEVRKQQLFEEVDNGVKDISDLIYGTEMEEWLKQRASDSDGESWGGRKTPDILMEDRSFAIELVFRRGAAGHFTFMTARIRADIIETDFAFALQTRQDFEAIELGYRVNASGEGQRSRNHVNFSRIQVRIFLTYSRQSYRKVLLDPR